MPVSKIDSDLSCNRLTPRSFDCPSDSIRDAAIPSSEQISATKLRHHLHGHYAQGSASTAASATQVVHVARFAGHVENLVAGLVGVNVGAATITIDLKKNDVSVLSSPLVLDSSHLARVPAAATLDPAEVDYAAGDVFELAATATAGGGTLGTGFFSTALFNEQSQ